MLYCELLNGTPAKTSHQDTYTCNEVYSALNHVFMDMKKTKLIHVSLYNIVVIPINLDCTADVVN